MLHTFINSYFSLVIFAFSLLFFLSKSLAIGVSTDQFIALNQLDNNNYSTLSKLISTTSPIWKNWKNLLFTLIALGIPTTLLVLKPSILSFIWSSMFNGTGSSRGNFMNRRRFKFGKQNDPTYQKVQKKGGNIGGLVNDGNTCFMNSVLQSLASSNSLDSYLQQESESQELAFTIAFKKLLDSLNAKHFSKNHDYKTNAMLRPMTKTPNKSFLMGYNQEDAQEFFQSLLSELESDYKKIHSSASTTNKTEPIYNTELPEDAVHGIDQLGHLGPVYILSSQIDPNLQDASLKSSQFNLITPVDGLSAERIGCLQCGEMGGIRYSVISGLSLNLPPDNYTALRLTDLLKKWIEPEIIEGVDCNRCALNAVLEYQTNQLSVLESKETPSVKLIELLKIRIGEIQTELEKPIIDDEIFKKLHTKNMMKKCSKAKQILISRPPPLLAMHINRSVFDPMTYRVRKNNARVVFPLKLDLDPFVAEPNDINTDARLPLSKKVVHDLQEEKAEEEFKEELEVEQNESLSSLETPEGSDKQDEDEQPVEESIKTKTTELSSDEDEDEDELDSEEDSDEDEHYPQSSNISTTLEKQDISGPLVYALRSVIVHYGTHNYGHYIAYRKYRGVWWRTSDETIDIVDEDEVLSAPGVFMLFYELDTLSKEDDEDLENGVEEVKIAGESDDEDEDGEDEDEGENDGEKDNEEGEDNEDSDNGDNLAQTIANL